MPRLDAVLRRRRAYAAAESSESIIKAELWKTKSYAGERVFDGIPSERSFRSCGFFTMFSFLSRIVVGVLAVVGAFVTLSDFIDKLSEGKTKGLSWSVDGRYLFRPSKYYEYSVRSSDGAIDTSEGLYVSVFNIWSTGSDSIKSEEIRSPLSINPRSERKIISYKVISVKSSLNDNFQINRQNGSLHIGWKVFDPDMGIKITVLHTGGDNSLSVDGKLGPGSNIIRFIEDTTRTLVSALLLLIVPIFVVGYCFWKLLNPKDPDFSIPREAWPFTHRHRMLVFVAGTVLLLLSGYFFTINVAAPYLLALTKRVSSPLPTGFVDEADASGR